MADDDQAPEEDSDRLHHEIEIPKGNAGTLIVGDPMPGSSVVEISAEEAEAAQIAFWRPEDSPVLNPIFGVLAKPLLLACIKEGDIILDPFDERMVNNSSIDVTLGEWYYEEQKPHSRPVAEAQAWSFDPSHHKYSPELDRRSTLLRGQNVIWTDNYRVDHLINPYDEESVRAMWGEPKQAKPLGYDIPGIRADEQVIVIPPGGSILAHTNEFVGGTDTVTTTMMKARSSMGRNLVEVCKCAGWGDISYFTRWTAEITNNSRWRHMVLVTGRRFAQIVFMLTSGVHAHEVYPETDGTKYQLSLDLEEMKKEWKPEMMLPRMWLDREVTDGAV